MLLQLLAHTLTFWHLLQLWIQPFVCMYLCCYITAASVACQCETRCQCVQNWATQGLTLEFQRENRVPCMLLSWLPEHHSVWQPLVYLCAVQRSAQPARLHQPSVRCRFHAFATYVVYGIQQLLPDNRCVIKEPVEDCEFHLALEDLEKLQPSQLNSVTCWLEKQVSDMCRLAVSPVNLIGHLSLDNLSLDRLSLDLLFAPWPSVP